MSHQTVNLLNPPKGYPRYIRPELAEKWFRQGKASFMDRSHHRMVLTCALHITSLHYQVSDARNKLRDAEEGYDRASKGPYAVKVTAKEARGIPFTSISKMGF